MYHEDSASASSNESWLLLSSNALSLVPHNALAVSLSVDLVAVISLKSTPSSVMYALLASLRLLNVCLLGLSEYALRLFCQACLEDDTS